MIESYGDVDQLWEAAVNDVVRYGAKTKSRSGGRDTQTLEVVGWSGRLSNPSLNFLANRRRKLCPVYASAELLWYLSGRNTLEAVTPYAPSYDKFAEPDGTAYGAYGYRLATNIGGVHTVNFAILRLDTSPESRQVVLSLWKPDDLLCEHKKDVPCTVCWQFLRRDDRLHMTTYMRSNDVWLGLPYDVYVFTCVQRLVAATIGCEVGTYTHNVGSLHIYDRDFERCREARYDQMTAPTRVHAWGMHDVWEDAGNAVAIESEMREGVLSSIDDKCEEYGICHVLRDSLACLSHRWHERPTYPSSPALREAVRRYKRPDARPVTTPTPT